MEMALEMLVGGWRERKAPRACWLWLADGKSMQTHMVQQAAPGLCLLHAAVSGFCGKRGALKAQPTCGEHITATKWPFIGLRFQRCWGPLPEGLAVP